MEPALQAGEIQDMHQARNEALAELNIADI